MKHYAAFFTQTGSEINGIRKALGYDPDLIITNRRDLEGVNAELIRDCKSKFVFLPKKPAEENYRSLIELHPEVFNNDIFILSGYLRIIPPFLCEYLKGRLYNLHPGLICENLDKDAHEDLKGFNPQEKAFNKGYEYSGAVIHEVTAGVDEGKILAYDKLRIKGMTLDEVYEKLHDLSINLWVKFLKEKLY